MVNLYLLLFVDKNTGELLLKNASQDYSGTYSCVASNRVGTDECSVELKVTPRKCLLCNSRTVFCVLKWNNLVSLSSEKVKATLLCY